MKVLQINNFHYLRGGSDRMYFETAQLLIDNGHEVAFFSSTDPENIPTKYEKYFTTGKSLASTSSVVQKIKQAKGFFYNTEAISKLNTLLKDFLPEIIHLHIFQSRLSSGIIKALKASNIPTVMTVHEYKILCPVYIFLDSKGKICEKCASGNYLHGIVNKCTQNNYLSSTINSLESYSRDSFFSYTKNIDAFVYPSLFIKNKHLQYKPSITKKSFVVPNFLNTDVFIPKKKVKNYLLYFGRLSKEKGVLTLVECMKYFPEKELLIIGKGPEEGLIKEIIKNHQLKNVVLLGPKYGDDLIQYIQQASFTIVPSEWYETFGLTIIESYSCGTPVIVSSIGGMTELVKENTTGFLFESRNISSLKMAIESAILAADSSEVYSYMSVKSREYAVKEFNKNDYYKNLMEVYSWVTKK